MWIVIAFGVGLALGLPLLATALGARSLRRLTMGPSLVEPVATEDVHDESRWVLYVPWIEGLERADFEPMGWMWLRTTTAATAEPTLAFALRHVDRSDVWAVIEPAELVSPALPVAITLHSRLPFGRWLESTIGRGYAAPPQVDCLDRNDPLVDSLAQLFVRHREVLGPVPAAMELPEFADAYRSAMDRQLEERVRAGQVVPTGEPDHYRCSMATAVDWARRQGRMQPAYWKHVARMGTERREPLDVPLIEEVRAFERYESLWQGRPKSRAWLAVLLVTGVLAFVSFAQLLDWSSALAIGIALLFHEGGHFLAMRAFGYRDSQVFFIPFLGAATTGQKPDATVAQEMIVLLAGPVPGLVLGGLLMILLPIFGLTGGFGDQLVLMLVAINLLNLLPVFPLDGGRILHRLIAAGRPMVDVAVRLLAVGLFLLAAVTVKDGITWVLAAFVAIGIPAGYRLAKWERTARALDVAPTDDPDRTRLLRVFSTLREAQDQNVRPTRVVLQAKQLRDRLTNDRTSTGTAILWLAIYGCTIVGGVVVLALVAAVTSLLAGSPDPMTETELAPFDCGSPPVTDDPMAVYECVLEDGAEARALEDEIAYHGTTSFSLCRAGPWTRGTPPGPAVRNARRTAAIAFEGYGGRQSGAEPFQIENLYGTPEALEAALATHAEEPWYDAEVATRIRAWLDRFDPADAAVLRERLACDEGEELPLYPEGIVLQHAVTGRSLRFTVQGDDASIGALLCARGCSPVSRGTP